MKSNIAEMVLGSTKCNFSTIRIGILVVFGTLYSLYTGISKIKKTLKGKIILHLLVSQKSTKRTDI